MKLFLKTVITGIAKLLAKANSWYDKLEEPTKFIVAVIYGYLPFMFFAGLGSAAGQGGFFVVGLLWVLIFVVALRTWWFYGNLRKYLE